MGHLSRRSRPIALVLILIVLSALLAWWHRAAGGRTPVVSAGVATTVVRTEATAGEIARACGGCHAVPTPDLFPRDLWPGEVERGFGFIKKQGPIPPGTPALLRVVDYYQRRAPGTLPVLAQTDPQAGPAPVQFDRVEYRLGRRCTPGIAHVRFLPRSGDSRLDVVACDMLNGLVVRLRPDDPDAVPEILSDAVPNPAHAEVADLDRDGLDDLLIANLGTTIALDRPVGSVVWLHAQPDGRFRAVTLAEGLGRVADVQAADFDADGDLDLVVAVFGSIDLGSILLLENRAEGSGPPVFVPKTLDDRHGTIHVPVADLNGDGRPDFLALLSQEHETVVAFLNEGGLRFRSEVVYQAPHPAFGSSGIQLIDLDGDGDQDVLLAHGDIMDHELLRPYHGIHWLENTGAFPFRSHHLTDLHGVHRALAADLDGDGDRDIVAVAFLPGGVYQRLRREHALDAVIVLEQVAPRRFIRHAMETITCDHPACDLGDFDADGRVDLVTGNAFLPYGRTPIGDRTDAPALTLWRNRGPYPAPH